MGIRRYQPEKLPDQELVGVVNGLAWTSVGGEILEVEAGVVPGSGKVELTGNLGSVMKESAQAALSYIRSRAVQLGIEADFYKTKDIHVHFPEGAVPKDGPSAGIAITTAMVSALTGAPVRREIAMTGEVTLRGRVLPIGGLKEKTMAAYRSGIKTVFLPADNVPDLEEIDPTVRAALHFVPVEQVDSVLAEALEQLSGAEEVLVTLRGDDLGFREALAASAPQVRLTFREGDFRLGGLIAESPDLGLRVDSSFDSAAGELSGHFAELFGLSLSDE